MREKHDLRAMRGAKYLGAWDLVDDAGEPKEYVLEIESVREEVLTSYKNGVKSEKVCPVIKFVGARKEFVCSARCNMDTIGGLYGYKVKPLVGKLLCLYGTKTMSFGKMVDCIRIKAEVPARKGETLADRPVDEAMRKRQTDAAGES